MGTTPVDREKSVLMTEELGNLVSGHSRTRFLIVYALGKLEAEFEKRVWALSLEPEN